MLTEAQNQQEKPYNLCINCAFMGKKCDGPNFLAMEPTRLAEWCRLRKEFLHRENSIWTNAYIAEQAGVSKTTVDRFLAGHMNDIKTSTISLILKVLIGTWGQYPCALGAINSEIDEDLKNRMEKSESECERLRKHIDAEEEKLKFYIEQIRNKDIQLAEMNQRMKERTDFLKRKDRAIRILLALLGGVAVCIIAAIIFDLTTPDIGYLWLR